MIEFSHKNSIETWLGWLSRHPKDFLETFGLIAGTLVTAIVAGLTFRLFQLNQKTLAANSRQNNQNILDAIFEEGMLNLEKTMSSLSEIEAGIQTQGSFYPNQFAPKREEVESQKVSAEKFGLRLDLYGVKKVSDEYKIWLQAMIDFMVVVREIQDKGHVDSYGMIYILDSERVKYAPRLSELIISLNTQKTKIMSEMNDLVSIS